VLTVLPLQLLAYHIAVLRGCDVDQFIHKQCVTLGVFSLVTGLNMGCSFVNTPHHSIQLPLPPARDLLLDLSYLPDGWEQPQGLTYLDRKGKGGVTSSEGYWERVSPPAGISQEVYAYGNVDDALDSFANLRELVFLTSSRQNSAPYLPPPEIKYQSSIADEYYLACGVDEVLICRALLRYRSYVIVLFMPSNELGNDGLMYSEIENTLIAVDKKIAKELSIDLLNSTIGPPFSTP
jgi:hypothetical protein